MREEQPWAVRSHFRFEIGANSSSKLPPPAARPRPFRDPAGPFVLAEIASRLRNGGFAVSEPKPAKACDAYLRAVFPRFELGMVLGVERQTNSMKFYLRTSPPRKMFRRESLLPSDLAEWDRLCDMVEEALKQDLRVSSLRRLTHDEAFRRSNLGN
jgi:hypothetical protein